MFRLCVLFSLRISSPSLYRYYLHVFPISRNCLAPPHFPESPHRAFIPQCIYSPHLSSRSLQVLSYFISYFLVFIFLCLKYPPFRYYSCFLFLIRSSLLILFPVSLPMSSKSCICIFHLSMSVGLFCFDFVTPPPSVCFILCIVYVWSSCCVYCKFDFLVLTLCSCSCRQLSCLLPLYLDISDYLDSDLCLFNYNFCLAQLNLFFHFTVHLGPFLHLPLIPRNRLKPKSKVNLIVICP